jgi:hypothetical protein
MAPTIFVSDFHRRFANALDQRAHDKALANTGDARSHF